MAAEVDASSASSSASHRSWFTAQQFQPEGQPLALTRHCEQRQQSSAVGVGNSVGVAVVGVGVGRGVGANVVVQSPPPQVQHMSSELKSESSYAPHREGCEK